MIYKFVPYMPFANGDNAFKAPSFWYRYVGKSINKFGFDYYLFPFNLIERVKRWWYQMRWNNAMKKYGKN